MSGIFKPYDIRGIYGETLSEELAFLIGHALVDFLNRDKAKRRKVVVGRDMRSHSATLADALAGGLMRQGANVVNLGLCSTPMSYYANGSLGADGGVMVTASHNPPEWNGFKLCREQAIPISGDTGIQEIERIVAQGSFAKPAVRPGKMSECDIGPDYYRHTAKCASLNRPIRIVADYANAMGILEVGGIKGALDIDPLFDTLDGSVPNHPANPLIPETLIALQRRIKSGSYDFGVAFDGDADRVGFVDEKGAIIPMDMITALIAQSVLRKEKGNILYDLRSSWAVREVIEENGGTPVMCRVGHSFIKRQMRDCCAPFAGELSGHYYFRDNYYTESPSMAVLAVANILSESDGPLSELVRPLRRYFASGEINCEARNAPVILNRLRKEYSAGRIRELDGMSVEFGDWWFNVRTSNTEPVMRLNVEARTQALMEQKRDDVLKIIRRE